VSKRLRQADPRWSKVMLGFGPGTIGRFGCALVSICQAAKFLRNVEFLPPHLNAMGRSAKAFKGELVIWDLLGRTAGLDVHPIIVGDGLLAAIASTLKAKGACLLHVDHKGDERGDHWVLAHGITDVGDIICSCSAVGGDVVISKETLRGSTTWGNEPKTYAVRGARPVFALT
jgi:hypothetical protein